MLLLLIFSMLAGAGTAVSPCVLPVLPVVLSVGATGGGRRPLGVITGLVASFTFATVALVYVISALGLPNDLLRTVAIGVLILFGVLLLMPSAAARLEGTISRFAGQVQVNQRSGFWSGMVAGSGLGLVYAPCAGPVLAGVITVSAAQAFTAARLAVALAYGLGSAIVLYILMVGGRRVTNRLSRRSGRFQMAMGALMVLFGLLMLGNYDTRFETAVASDLPAFLVDPTHSLESSSAAQRQLAALRERPRAQTAGAGLAEARRASALPILGPAPDFTDTQRWFNTPGGQPLSLASLRGRVVLIDFWTYTCINCIRTLPYLRAWDARYRDKGLTVVGVHTPEFPFERSADNVQAAIAQNGLRYPVAQDNHYGTWNAYQNQYWPAEYLIDAQGQVRLTHFGEGDYAAKEAAIRGLLVEKGARALTAPTNTQAEQPSNQEITPESYLGSKLATRFADGPVRGGVRDYGQSLPAKPLALSHLRFGGSWRISPTAATAGSGSTLDLSFRARRVFLVLGSPAAARKVEVLLDGRRIPVRLSGSDVHSGEVTVRSQRLYRLVDLPGVETRRLTLRLPAAVSGYAFTFG